MTPFPFSVGADRPLAEARRMMREHDIRHLPVKEGEALVGVVSDRELERALATGADAGRSGPAVREVMVEAFAVELSTPADRVLLEMAERHGGSALVTRRGRLVGIFTATDACRCFSQWLASQFRPPSGDHAA